MKVTEMRELTADELKGRIDDTRKEIVKMRFDHATRKLESPAKMQVTRKRLAQLLTVQSEKERELEKKAQV